MLLKAKSSLSQGTYSVRRKKKKKSKLYFSIKKAFKKSRMRTTNKKLNFRRPSKLLDFGNANVADIASVTNRVLQAV